MGHSKDRRSEDVHVAGRLSNLDMNKHLGTHEYDERLKRVQTTFERIQQAYLHTKDSGIVVFEGWDAAGKGGTIRRMSSVMDPRGFKVWPIAAPDEKDLKRHYLARFWDRVPSAGEICVFDRSWYGRVLVERVEGLATAETWKRAYQEINEFERLLTDAGTRIVKVFLYITPDEQLKRLESRMEDPLKRWKLSYEDFRNRDKWTEYEKAANEMLERTDTEHAPWLLLPANDKKYARITALEEIAKRLSDGCDLSPPPVDEKIEKQYRKMLKAERGAKED